MIPEKIIQRQILGYLKVVCLAVGKTKTTGLYDPTRRCFRSDPFLFKGFPDICGFTKGYKIFFVEVKSEKGRQSEEQKAFEEFCRRAGITYVLARCVEDVQAKIN